MGPLERRVRKIENLRGLAEGNWRRLRHVPVTEWPEAALLNYLAHQLGKPASAVTEADIALLVAEAACA